MAYKKLGIDNRYYYFTNSGRRIGTKKYHSIKKADRTRRENIRLKTELLKPDVFKVKEKTETVAFVKLNYFRTLTKQERKKRKPYKRTKKINKNYVIDSGISRRGNEFEIHKRIISIDKVKETIDSYAFDGSNGFRFNASVQLVTGTIDLKTELVSGYVSKITVLRNFNKRYDNRKRDYVPVKNKRELQQQYLKELDLFAAILQQVIDEYVNEDTGTDEPEFLT
jgi:hypothetical protein